MRIPKQGLALITFFALGTAALTTPGFAQTAAGTLGVGASPEIGGGAGRDNGMANATRAAAGRTEAPAGVGATSGAVGVGAGAASGTVGGGVDSGAPR